MSFDLTLFTSTFVTLFVILDPPGAIPIFLALTGPLTAKQKAAAARRASLVALGVIASFALFGQRILDYLHISLPALQGAGGLLLLIVALQLLTGSESEQTGGCRGERRARAARHAAVGRARVRSSRRCWRCRGPRGRGLPGRRRWPW